MPQIKSAKKSLLQDKKKSARNLNKKKKIEMLTRKIKQAMRDKKLAEVEKIFHDLQKAIDKAAKKKIWHKNKAARIKSRLQKKIKALKK